MAATDKYSVCKVSGTPYFVLRRNEYRREGEKIRCYMDEDEVWKTTNRNEADELCAHLCEIIEPYEIRLWLGKTWRGDYD